MMIVTTESVNKHMCDRHTTATSQHDESRASLLAHTPTDCPAVSRPALAGSALTEAPTVLPRAIRAASIDSTSAAVKFPRCIISSSADRVFPRVGPDELPGNVERLESVCTLCSCVSPEAERTDVLRGSLRAVSSVQPMSIDGASSNPANTKLQRMVS